MFTGNVFFSSEVVVWLDLGNKSTLVKVREEYYVILDCKSGYWLEDKLNMSVKVLFTTFCMDILQLCRPFFINIMLVKKKDVIQVALHF